MEVWKTLDEIEVGEYFTDDKFDPKVSDIFLKADSLLPEDTIVILENNSLCTEEELMEDYDNDAETTFLILTARQVADWYLDIAAKEESEEKRTQMVANRPNPTVSKVKRI